VSIPSTPYFQRREDWHTPRTPKESQFRQFLVQCFNCKSFNVLVKPDFNEEAQELKLVLFCPSCQTREFVPVR